MIVSLLLAAAVAAIPPGREFDEHDANCYAIVLDVY
jgi:hypothetical protein